MIKSICKCNVLKSGIGVLKSKFELHLQIKLYGNQTFYPRLNRRHLTTNAVVLFYFFSILLSLHVVYSVSISNW